MDYLQRAEPRGRPEPIRRRPVNVIDGFGTVSPSVGEILDHIAQNFFGFHQKSHGSCQRLGLEIVLDRREAFFGVSMPIEMVAKLKPEFDKRRCKVLGISVDDVESHKRWRRNPAASIISLAFASVSFG